MRKGLCVLVTASVLIGSAGTGCGAHSPGPAVALIGVILPDNESPRWEGADRPFLEGELTSPGVRFDIRNADADPQKFEKLAHELMDDGAMVLVIANLDPTSGKAVIDKAHAQGVTVIDYDRPTIGGGADYFVGYDSVAAGRLKAEGMVRCLDAAPITPPVVARLDGPPTDSSAELRAMGSAEVLQARFDAAEFTAGPVESLPEWDDAMAVETFTQMMTQTGGHIDGVIVANDDIGHAVISVLKRHGLNGRVAVTGQDATVRGLRNVLAGDQCMTVYMPVKQGAVAVAAMALAVALHEPINTGQVFTDPVSGQQMPARVLKPLPVDRDGVKRLVDDEVLNRDDLCTRAYEEACEKAGIS
jgi:D-xylose transport system substrate-binding protein